MQESIYSRTDTGELALDRSDGVDQQGAVGEGYPNLDPDEQQVWNYVDLSIFQDAVKQMDANGLLPNQ